MNRSKTQELERILEKLSYYMQNNYRVCDRCFTEFMRA